MRIAAYIIIVIGLIFLSDAAMEAWSGEALAISPGSGARVVAAERSENPEEFKRIMSYQWIRASATLGGGLILLSFVRRADRMDPFAT